MGRRLRRRNDGDNVNNVQCKPNWNCHYESPLYNVYILMKNLLKVEFKKKKKLEASSAKPCLQSKEKQKVLRTQLIW
jgi:hypothetical protein